MQPFYMSVQRREKVQTPFVMLFIMQRYHSKHRAAQRSFLETHGIWNEQAEKYLLAQFGVDIGEAAQ